MIDIQKLLDDQFTHPESIKAFIDTMTHFDNRVIKITFEKNDYYYCKNILIEPEGILFLINPFKIERYGADDKEVADEATITIYRSFVGKFKTFTIRKIPFNMFNHAYKITVKCNILDKEYTFIHPDLQIKKQ